MRIGCGYDLHRYGRGDHVMLGGVRVPHAQGVVAHSDGDVLLHALMDALLGAAGAGDIGQHFPPGDPHYAGADSRGMLREVMRLVAARGFVVENCDLTLLAEARASARTAKRSARRSRRNSRWSARVNLKATTAEGLGALGRAEGIAAQAIVLLREVDGV